MGVRPSFTISSRCYYLRVVTIIKIKIKLIKEIFIMKETVTNIIAEYLGKDASEISTTDTFKEIGLDSLDIMELVMQIEDEVDCKIELSQDMDNIEKLCEYIENNK